MATMEIDPADLRFTQDSIKAHFRFPHDHYSVRDAVRELRNGKMRPTSFPRLRVMVTGDGCMWSLDNRRLWAFRLAGCSSITVDLVTELHPRLLEVYRDPLLHSMLIKADYLPRVRGRPDWAFDTSVKQGLDRHLKGSQLHPGYHLIPLETAATISRKLADDPIKMPNRELHFTPPEQHVKPKEQIVPKRAEGHNPLHWPVGALAAIIGRAIGGLCKLIFGRG